jgi:hypothetical protein
MFEVFIYQGDSGCPGGQNKMLFDNLSGYASVSETEPAGETLIPRFVRERVRF